MTKNTRFSPEVRQRAVRMVLESQGEYDSQWAAILSWVQGSTDHYAMSISNRTKNSLSVGYSVFQADPSNGPFLFS